MDQISDFRAAMLAHGLTPPNVIERGKRHRFPSNDKRNDDAGWCLLFDDGLGGVYGDWRTGLSEVWQAKRERPLSASEWQRFNMQCAEARERARLEREERYAKAKDQALRIWSDAGAASKEHPYLLRKAVGVHGVRATGNRLVIPLRDSSGNLHSVQFISGDGTKRYLGDGRVKGCYFTLGRPSALVCIAEGFATAATIHEVTGHAVAVAFDANNLEPVARALRAKYPSLDLVLCADDDVATPGNPGRTKATQAAQAVNGRLALPCFGDLSSHAGTDFNDLARLCGPDAVRSAVASAKHVAAPTPPMVDGNASGSPQWPEPSPLVAEQDCQPYPLDALPGVIGAAVREVVDFVQCPEALAACCALSAVSLSAQGLADVRRAEGLTGPLSLFVLAIAESGERKTSADGYFLAPIREWEAVQAEALKPEIAQHSAALKAWEARREGLLAKIKELSKGNKPSAREEAELAELEGDKPHAPRIPRMLFGDVTPEALAWKLASGWPSAGVLSSEAGIVFGGHGMKADSVMRNLALLNVLWDGGAQRVDRKQSDCFTLQGARLTMGLAVQPDTVRSFLDATRGLARGTGFAARFLIAWPESTQGRRAFKEPPANWPCLAAFHRRVTELLSEPLSLSDTGELSPPALELSASAKAEWIRFHDAVEAELRPGGDMEQARDVASKAADNAARLAGLFHVFARGPRGSIGEEHMRAGASIARWHLYEARRFLASQAMPRAASNATKLDAWLIQRCTYTKAASISTRDVQQRGPNALRDTKTLAEALEILAEAGRARLIESGKQRRIAVNPALLAGGESAA